MFWTFIALSVILFVAGVIVVAVSLKNKQIRIIQKKVFQRFWKIGIAILILGAIISVLTFVFIPSIAIWFIIATLMGLSFLYIFGSFKIVQDTVNKNDSQGSKPFD